MNTSNVISEIDKMQQLRRGGGGGGGGHPPSVNLSPVVILAL